MENVYENCPEFENERFYLRLLKRSDADDLLKVYSDKRALPFFNSDNCDGDNFYYPTMDKMLSAVDFWIRSYEDKWFVRWVIIDKSSSCIVGTIELFRRISKDDFNGCGVLRLDLGCSYENANDIYEVLSLIIPSAFDLFECSKIITKVPVYALDRTDAVSRFGFEKTDSVLLDDEGFAFKGYWIVKKDR